MSRQRQQPPDEVGDHRWSRERGVALVTVIMIASILSALSYHILTRHTTTLAFSSQHFGWNQAREFARGAELAARRILIEDLVNDRTREADTLLEPWATTTEPIESDYGRVTFQINDLQSRLNLNSVLEQNGKDQIQRIRRLCEMLKVEPRIPELWMHWIDSDQVSDQGGESDTYLLLEPPYRTPDDYAVNLSEVNAMIELHPAEFRLLGKFVHGSNAPQTFLVNINTASAEVISSLDPSISIGHGQKIAERQREWKAVEDAVRDEAALRKVADALTVRSNLFEVQIKVELGEVRFEMVSVLHRNPESGDISLMYRDYAQLVEFDDRESS